MNASDLILPRVKNMPPSGIRKYFDLINEMKDAISLGIGEPDFVTPSGIRDAGIHSLERGETYYSPNAGFFELRREIAAYLSGRFGIDYNPKDEILVTVGGSEGIDASLRALAGPGDEVIIPEPCFVAYKGCTVFNGATPVSLKLRVEDEFKLTPDLLKASITDKTKVIILSYPNNPTGATMTRDELARIVEILKDKNIIVISDEIYAELTYKGQHVSIASFPGMKDRTIVISGFSKAFAMTGWRVGYACGSAEIIGAMIKIHQYAIMSSPTIAQKAALEALRNGKGEVLKMAMEYDKRRRIIVDGFNEAGLNCFEPYGAFYVFPCIKSTGMSSEEFCDALLCEEKVLVIPGKAFGDCGEGFIRATYANSIENIYEALSRIKRFIIKNNLKREA